MSDVALIARTAKRTAGGSDLYLHKLFGQAAVLARLLADSIYTHPTDRQCIYESAYGRLRTDSNADTQNDRGHRKCLKVPIRAVCEKEMRSRSRSSMPVSMPTPVPKVFERNLDPHPAVPRPQATMCKICGLIMKSNMDKSYSQDIVVNRRKWGSNYRNNRCKVVQRL